MKNKYVKISLQVLLVFSTLILVSFIPDYLHDFFGDTLCEGRVYNRMGDFSKNYYSGCDYLDYNEHNPMWHWGYRHWIWIIMGVCLFIIQLVRVGDIIDDSVNDKH